MITERQYCFFTGLPAPRRRYEVHDKVQKPRGPNRESNQVAKVESLAEQKTKAHSVGTKLKVSHEQRRNVMPDENGYRRTIGTEHPGLVMILLDQSGSMKDDKKMYWAADAVNRTILEIQGACRKGAKIADRLFVGVIGYGNREVVPMVGGPISEVAGKATGVKRIVSENLEVPVWVEPKADGNTPMADAFAKASDLISGWASEHQKSFPPVVIHITDGEPDDIDKTGERAPETESRVAELMEIGTEDGKSLLFNAHITGTTSQEIVLPSSLEELKEPYARLLFRLSSALPVNVFHHAKSVGLNPQHGARSMIFNSSPATLIKLLIFGSTVGGR